MAKILVVQDVELNIVDIKLSLESAGHRLTIARNVDLAINLLGAGSFDLLICGVHLQNSNVFELLKFVKGDADRHNMPFIFFCCSPKSIAKYVSETAQKTAMLLGADKYITQEDFDATQFRTEIESLLPESTNELSAKGN